MSTTEPLLGVPSTCAAGLSGLDRAAKTWWQRVMQARHGLDQRLRGDVTVGLISLVLVAIAGLAVNTLVGRYYPPEVLGQFSQIFALYALVAQLAAAGCQYSAVKFVAEAHGDVRREALVVVSGLAVTLVTSTVASMAFWGIRQPLADLMRSEPLAVGLAWITPALFMFTINKVAMAVFNGQRRMRLYAGLQAARPVLLMIALGVAVTARVPGPQLPVIFIVAEGLLLMACAIPLLGPLRTVYRMGNEAREVWSHARSHLSFGLRSVLSGVLLQLNTRIDVLMLGLWTTDHVVGLYALAATFSEGLSQLPLLFRRNFNPLLAQLSAGNKTAELQRLIHDGKRYVMLIVGAITILCVALFPAWISLATGRLNEYWSSWPMLAILAVGVAGSAGSVAFRQLLLQAGYPGTYTGVLVACCAVNAAINVLLIPLWGGCGAAVATTLAMLASVLVMRQIIRRTLCVHV